MMRDTREINDRRARLACLKTCNVTRRNEEQDRKVLLGEISLLTHLAQPSAESNVNFGSPIAKSALVRAFGSGETRPIYVHHASQFPT